MEHVGAQFLDLEFKHSECNHKTRACSNLNRHDKDIHFHLIKMLDGSAIIENLNCFEELSGTGSLPINCEA